MPDLGAYLYYAAVWAAIVVVFALVAKFAMACAFGSRGHRCGYRSSCIAAVLAAAPLSVWSGYLRFEAGVAYAAVAFGVVSWLMVSRFVWSKPKPPEPVPRKR